MKKLLTVAAIVATSFAATAQDKQVTDAPTPEAKADETVAQFASLNLDATQTDGVKQTFVTYYTKKHALKEEWKGKMGNAKDKAKEGDATTPPPPPPPTTTDAAAQTPPPTADAAQAASPEKSAMKEQMVALATERDNALKGILNETQYKDYEEKIKPALEAKKDGKKQ